MFLYFMCCFGVIMNEWMNELCQISWRACWPAAAAVWRHRGDVGVCLRVTAVTGVYLGVRRRQSRSVVYRLAATVDVELRPTAAVVVQRSSATSVNVLRLENCQTTATRPAAQTKTVRHHFRQNNYRLTAWIRTVRRPLIARKQKSHPERITSFNTSCSVRSKWV